MKQASCDARHLTISALVVSLAVLAAAACSGSVTGDEGGACYPNATCNAGLACTSGACVASHAVGSSGSSGSTSATGSGGASGSGGAASTSSTGGATSSGTTSTATGTAATSTSSATSSSGGEGPPVFLAFGTDVTSITVGQSVTISAVLTDPGGVTDVIGGDLVDEYGSTYGAFATSGQMGAYQMMVTWAQINTAHSIEFAYGATAQRTLTATFFDQAANSAQKQVTITLTCKGLAASGGACYDTMQDAQNCGMVGNACGNGVQCFMGECAAFGACQGPITSCTAQCAAMGKVCANKCGPQGAWGTSVYMSTLCQMAWGGLTCDTSLDGYKSSQCCCF